MMTQKQKDFIVACLSLIIILLGTALIIAGAISIGNSITGDKDDNETTKTPVEERKNDSIYMKIIQLDSLKNEKVIEVKGLSNDSTLKLFNRLTRE